MTAKLHYELVAPAGAAAAPPRSWLMVVHGIFGSGGNWRSIVRRLVERRPSWGAVLVDLRGHGRSASGEPPHTIEACAADLLVLDRALGAEGRPVRAALGHSLGGKVVLALRRLTAHGIGVTARTADLLQTWMLDATPGARPEALHDPADSVRRVLELLEAQPAEVAHRDAFVDAMLQGGLAEPIARWLAMNLEPAGDAFRLRLDLAVVRAVLADYFQRDEWRAVEDPEMPGELHVVCAGRSDSVPHDARVRLAAHQQHTGLTHVHLVPEAGHWLHLDAPDAVVELLAGALPNPA
jgi:esterase